MEPLGDDFCVLERSWADFLSIFGQFLVPKSTPNRPKIERVGPPESLLFFDWLPRSLLALFDAYRVHVENALYAFRIVFYESKRTSRDAYLIACRSKSNRENH